MRVASYVVLACSLLCSTAVFAGMSVSVTMRGKQYHINDVDTVSELQVKLEEASGVAPGSQGRVLFDGKRLTGDQKLTTAGVSEGAQLNVVPSKKKSSSSSSKSTAPNVAAAAASTSASSSTSSASATPSLDDMMKQMGGGEGGAPSMQESMQAMSSMMNSPIFKEYMNDPEKLEQSRQMILQNPMLKGMMAGMPGMEELLNSPEAWREAMQAAAQMYQNMDQEDLMNAMQQGMNASGGMPGGMPPGLFGDASPSSNDNLSALDELSEGED